MKAIVSSVAGKPTVTTTIGFPVKGGVLGFLYFSQHNVDPDIQATMEEMVRRWNLADPDASAQAG